ncbi:patatin-like phospholipase family protein [Rhizobium leguminosarum]|uniref:patatin-like phospholipase family protein n=1 Tax=Rhizobium leguminosarum TaxID=384 RepID=UPI0032B11238
MEGLIGCRLCEKFDLVFGTSTGAIIASMIALGMSVDEIHANYKKYIPDIMRLKKPAQKSAKLAELAEEIYGDAKFDEVKTAVGIVTTKWVIERPMIFKGSIEQAHGRKGTFTPGFGVKIGDAVQASCSAFPFFLPKTVTNAAGDEVKLVDGGYCANNPTLYAIADATRALALAHEDLRVVSVGVGVYPSRSSRCSARCIGRNTFRAFSSCRRPSKSTRSQWTNFGRSFSRTYPQSAYPTPSSSRKWPPTCSSTTSASSIFSVSAAETPLPKMSLC